MISRLRGKLISLGDGRAELRCGFITYQIFLPSYLEAELSTEFEQVIELYIFEFLENPSQNQYIPGLVGFGSELEREFFELLLRVPGMGVKSALKVLKLRPEKLAELIASQNISLLAELPGLGKKTAERMVSELKNQMDRFLKEKPEVARVSLGEEEIMAVEILVDLGLRRGEAETLVRRARSRGVSGTDQLVQEALRERGRKTAEVRR